LKNLPDGTYHVEPKYAGEMAEIHKAGGKVIVFGVDGADYTEKFPGIVKEIEENQGDNFVAVGQMTRWRGRQRLGREDVTAYLKAQAEAYSDHEMKYKVCDMPVRDGVDVSNETLIQRRAAMEEIISWGKQVQPTVYKTVEHKRGDGGIVAAVEDRKTREGAMIKNVEATYNKAAESTMYEWATQKEIDVRVTKKNGEAGAWSYDCEAGRHAECQGIGATYNTDKAAEVGDVLRVSVDRVTLEGEKYMWHTPRVVEVTRKKIPDPISTLKRIADIKPEPRSQNIITLTEIVPKLKKGNIEKEIFLVGGIVENGLATQSVQVLTVVEMSEEEKSQVLAALGDRVAPYVEFIYNPEGPQGASLSIVADLAEEKGVWKHSDKFVLQEHGWGKKVHYDLRFGSPKTEKVSGFTCLSKPTTEAGGTKVRCQEKKPHDAKWMDVNREDIRPGEEGHPGEETHKGTARMLKLDSGRYEFVKKKADFIEVMLRGKTWKGRYILRLIDVQSKEIVKHKGGEDELKNDRLWIMSKPIEQTAGAPIKKLAFKYVEEYGCLTFWETAEDEPAQE